MTLYSLLIFVIPVALFGVILWAALGKFDDEMKGYDK
jgi:hypothetical protein